MTPDTRERSAVAVYTTHTAAEAAVKALQRAGVDMKRLSIVGKDFHTEEHVLGFYTAGERMKFWGTRGAFWGSLWGVLFGSAFFFIPVLGPLVVMGPLVGWIVGALEGAAVGGAGGVLAAAFASLGIPKDSVVKYELAVKTGSYLILAHGDAEMIEHARAVLATTGAAQLATHARTELLARDGILNLLSDDEVAAVSTAETAPRLSDGDEYIDLEQLDQGVRRALGATAPMGSVLPRKAIHDATWRKILARLPAPYVQETGAGQ
jgi:hypothetical protein